MPKQCPTCRRIHADHVQFCDMDATPLRSLETNVAPAPPAMPPAPAGRARRRWIQLSIGLVLLAAAAVGAHQLYSQHLKTHFAVTLENVFLTAESAGLLERALTLAQVATGNANLVARVRLDNSTIFSGTITAARYSLRTGERELGQGVWTAPQPIPFQPGQQVSLDLPFRLDSRGALGSLFDQISGQLNGQWAGREGPLRMQGELTVRVWGLDFPIPFDVSFQGVRLEQPTSPVY